MNSIFYQELDNHLISSRNKIYVGEIKFNLNVAYQSAGLAHIGEENTYEIQMRLGTLTYETKFYLPSDNKTDYILGFQGMNQMNRNINDRETILLPDAETNAIGVFGFIQHSLFEKLKLQAGIRFDKKTLSSEAVGDINDLTHFRPSLNKSYNSFSGSIGASYSITESMILRTNFASAYRTPNLAELSSNGQHELRYEKGDANLTPETSYEFDLSLHYHKENFTFDIAGFINNVDNFIFISPTGDTTLNGINIYKYKQADAKLFGGEAGLHVHPTSAKWLHFETTFSSVIGKQKDGKFLPFVPAKKLRFELRGESPKIMFIENAFVSLNSDIAFAQNNTADDETPTKGYALFDLSLGGNLHVLNSPVLLVLSVMNLFDKKYIDNLSTLEEVNYFNPGRNFTLSLSVQFGQN